MSTEKKIRYHDKERNKKKEVIFKHDGDLHRKDGPAYICWDKDGNKMFESYYQEGEHHRTDGPASVWWNENGSKKRETYYQNGKCHRENGPADINYSVEGEILSEQYYVNDELHRTDGPAYIEWYGKSGRIRSKEYRIHGDLLSEQEFYRWKIKNGLEKRL